MEKETCVPQVRQAGWNTPTCLSESFNPNGNHADDAHVVFVTIDERGNITILWRQYQSNLLQVPYEDKLYQSEYNVSADRWSHPDEDDAVDYHSTRLGRYFDEIKSWGFDYDAVIDKKRLTFCVGDANSTYYFYDYNASNRAFTEIAKVAPSVSGNSLERKSFAVNDKKIVMVWSEWNDKKYYLFTADYNRSQNTWNLPASLEDAVTINGWQYFDNPDITLNGSGQEIMTWQYPNSGNYQKNYLAEFNTSNDTWGLPATLYDNFNPASHISKPAQVYLSEMGRATLIWVENDRDNDHGFMSQYDPHTASWTHPKDGNDHFTFALSDVEEMPRFISNETDDAILLWRQSDFEHIRLYMSRYDKTDKRWIHPQSLSQAISFEDSDVSDFDFDGAVDDNGDILVVWTQSDGNSKKIFKREYSSEDMNWSFPVSISDNIGFKDYDAIEPKAIMKNGKKLIVWKHIDEEGRIRMFVSDYVK